MHSRTSISPHVEFIRPEFRRLQALARRERAPRQPSAPALQKRWWLCVLPTLWSAAGVMLTLMYQPAAYWAGNYAAGSEAMPGFSTLLHLHPAAFIAGSLVWIAAFNAGILFMRPRAATRFSVCMVLFHQWGATSWIFAFVPHGFWINLVLILATAVLLVKTWERAADPVYK
jgi:hypothetical protein